MPRRVRILGRKKAMTSYPKVHLNDPGANRKGHFPSNQITTTKYTLLNFLPKNLFEQFRRVTNIYFLCIVIITLIPAISPLTPWTSIAPLAFVLGVTALKEGYEDFVCPPLPSLLPRDAPFSPALVLLLLVLLVVRVHACRDATRPTTRSTTKSIS